MGPMSILLFGMEEKETKQHDDTGYCDLKLTKKKNPKETPWALYIAAMIINLPQFGVGCTLGWMSPTIPKLMEKDSHIIITLDQGSQLGTWMLIGSILGPGCVGLTVDRLGRRGSLQLAAFLSLLSWLLLAVVPSVELLFLARFIAGLSISMELSLSPLYVAEISQPGKRGTLTSMIQCMSNTGYLVVYGVGPFVSYTTLCVVCALPMVAFLVLSLTLHESPYHLTALGKIQMATDSLKAYRKDVIDTQQQLDIIEETISGSIGYRQSFRLLFRCPNHRRALALSTMVFFFFEFTGMIALTAYAQPILLESGASSPESTNYSSMVIGVVKVTAGLVTPFITALFGVRLMFILSSAVVALDQCVLGVYFYLHNLNYNLTSFSWLPLTCITVYTSCLSIGLSSLPFTVMSEMFSPKVKAAGAMVSSTINCSLAYLVILLFGQLTSRWYICFWLFSGVTTFAIPFVLVFIPDTRKMTLEDIQQWLRK